MHKALTTILIITTILTLKIGKCYGQTLIGMDYNHAILNRNSIHGNLKAAVTASVDTFHFKGEFFEDFTTYGDNIYPDPKKWSDRYAFINSTWADSMLSYGVATLDALDANGLPYPSTQQVVPSDTLTSDPFKFDSIPTEQLYLSFFYEAGGKGDMPDSTDSLCVDLYSPQTDNWIEVSAMPGGTWMHNFKQEIIAIDKSYVHDGFRFRFRNYTSLSAESVLGGKAAVSNGDQWNIDYIQVKATSNIDIIKNVDDVMINEPLKSSLLTYNSVPFSHLKFAIESDGRTHIPLSVRTYYPELTDSVRVTRNYVSFNLLTNTDSIPLTAIANDIPRFTIYKTNDDFTPPSVYDPSKKKGELKTIAYITTNDNRENRVNDTISRTDYFYNYYAYDDGSAEFGIGISGEQQVNSRLALKFPIYRLSSDPDTLKAVDIYFNKARDLFNKDAQFKVFIREIHDTVPADTDIYVSNEVYTPDTTLGIQQFMRIPMEDTLMVADTIMVGVIQLNKYLNIGYDINDNSLPNFYVYTNSTWTRPGTKSFEKGTMMLRLEFGGPSQVSAIKETHTVKPQFLLYPNPAHDILHFRLQDMPAGMVRVRVFDLLGRVEIDCETDTYSIDVSGLSPGIHFLQLISGQGEQLRTVKFIRQ